MLGRSGEWVRVQLDGWIREADLKPADNGVLRERHRGGGAAVARPVRGAAVEWRLQLIAVQTADELRTEMPAGQTYLLTRGPLPEPGFVYVTVPDTRSREFRALPPLQELTLRVTIKAARTKYLATPVVELCCPVESGLERALGGPDERPPQAADPRLLETLSDERGYQILDYVEFLDSKYAERARPGGLFARITETVENTMRAGKLPIQAISGTMGLMDSAAKVMRGLAAAGQAVVDEAVKAAESASKPAEPDGTAVAEHRRSKTCSSAAAHFTPQSGHPWPHRPRLRPRHDLAPPPSSSAASARSPPSPWWSAP